MEPTKETEKKFPAPVSGPLSAKNFGQAKEVRKFENGKVELVEFGNAVVGRSTLEPSTPVLRMANQVTGAVNTPAMASSTTLAENSTSEVTPSSSSRSSSSYDSLSYASSSNSSSGTSSRRYQSKGSSSQRPSEVIASSNGPKVITTSRNGLAAGERVVKEVDLTRGTNFKVANAATPPRGQGNSSREAPADRIAGISKKPTSAVPTASASLGGEIASPGPINLGSNGGSSGSLSSPSEPNSPSGGASATQNNTTSSREEIVTFLSSGSYSVTRNKLRDTNFVNTLKSNKVTMIDL